MSSAVQRLDSLFRLAHKGTTPGERANAKTAFDRALAKLDGPYRPPSCDCGKCTAAEARRRARLERERRQRAEQAEQMQRRFAAEQAERDRKRRAEQSAEQKRRLDLEKLLTIGRSVTPRPRCQHGDMTFVPAGRWRKGTEHGPCYRCPHWSDNCPKPWDKPASPWDVSLEETEEELTRLTFSSFSNVNVFSTTIPGL